ncbi:MAG: MFS transporter [Haloarculaceae archaeon]
MSRSQAAGGPTTRLRSRLGGPWDVVLALGVLIAAVNAYYIVPAGVLPVIREELALGPATAGLLVSVMFGAQMLLGVPVGMLIDRVDNRRAVVAATLAILGLYAWSWQAAAAGDFWALMLSRGLAAPATAAIWTAGVNIIGRAFDPARQATAVGVFSGGPAAGFAVGLLTGPLVANRFGWAAIFAVYAVPAAVGCALFWVTSHRLDISVEDTATARLADFGKLFTTATVWTVALVAFVGFSLYAFVTSWVPTYLSEVVGVSLAEGGLLAAFFPAVGAVARAGSGAVSDRLFGHRRRPVVLLAFAVSAPAIFLVVLADTVAILLLALLVAGVFLQLGLGLAYPLARETADPAVAATGVAFTTSMATFGGFVAPPVGGLLIDHSGYLVAFSGALLLGLAGATLAWFVPEPDFDGG